jgi:RNA polymerase sigma-70 factor (ECF subfamily)
VDRLVGDPALDGYPYLAAVRADLLRRLGRRGEAAVAYREALASTTNSAEAEFLSERLRGLNG